MENTRVYAGTSLLKTSTKIIGVIGILAFYTGLDLLVKTKSIALTWIIIAAGVLLFTTSLVSARTIDRHSIKAAGLTVILGLPSMITSLGVAALFFLLGGFLLIVLGLATGIFGVLFFIAAITVWRDMRWYHNKKNCRD